MSAYIVTGEDGTHTANTIERAQDVAVEVYYGRRGTDLDDVAAGVGADDSVRGRWLDSYDAICGLPSTGDTVTLPDGSRITVFAVPATYTPDNLLGNVLGVICDRTDATLDEVIPRFVAAYAADGDFATAEDRFWNTVGGPACDTVQGRLEDATYGGNL